MLVNGGAVVQASAQSNLGGNPAVFNPGQLTLDNGTLQPTASFALNNPNSGVTLGAGGGTFNVSNLVLTVSNPITGPGNLICTGSGTLKLSGTNTYTGNTTVRSGTLEIGQPTLAKISTVSVSNSAVLRLSFSTTNKVAALVLNGVSQAAGVYNSTTASPVITGSGALLVGPPINLTPTNLTAAFISGSLVLSWPADHIGWTILSQTNNLNKGVSANTNDWLRLTGSTTTNQITLPISSALTGGYYQLVYP